LSCAISSDGRAITCHGCGHTSHHPDDVAAKYCGHCHVFHDEEAHPCEDCGLLLVRVLVPGVKNAAKLPRRCSHCDSGP
jgi:hypothetical protein